MQSDPSFAIHVVDATLNTINNAGTITSLGLNQPNDAIRVSSSSVVKHLINSGTIVGGILGHKLDGLSGTIEKVTNSGDIQGYLDYGSAVGCILPMGRVELLDQATGLTLLSTGTNNSASVATDWASVITSFAGRMDVAVSGQADGSIDHPLLEVTDAAGVSSMQPTLINFNSRERRILLKRAIYVFAHVRGVHR